MKRVLRKSEKKVGVGGGVSESEGGANWGMSQCSDKSRERSSIEPDFKVPITPAFNLKRSSKEH